MTIAQARSLLALPAISALLPPRRCSSWQRPGSATNEGRVPRVGGAELSAARAVAKGTVGATAFRSVARIGGQPPLQVAGAAEIEQILRQLLQARQD